MKVMETARNSVLSMYGKLPFTSVGGIFDTLAHMKEYV